MSRRALAAVLALVAGVVAPLTVTSAAAARAAGSIELTALTPRIDVGTSPRFQYTTHSLGTSATIALQRYTGSEWKTLKPAPKGTDLTVTAPALGSPNKYVYRMYSSTGVASPVRFVYAYGHVSMATLCPHTDSTQQFPRVCKQKTVQVGNTTLATSMAIGAVKYPNFYSGAYAPRPSCRSANLRFTTNANSTFKAYLKITQGDGVPVLRGQATAGVARIGTLNVTFGSGRLFFNGATEDPNGGSVFIAGTFSCWTTTGVY